MKRFHVHVHVADLQKSIEFYSRMFAGAPTRIESDYAKWMIEDPRINFAISTRGASVGVDHLGIQADSAKELTELKAQARSADMTLTTEGEVSCCYARSDKYWLTDPQGVAWEQFHTLGDIPMFSEKQASKAGCCPTASASSSSKPEAVAAKACC